MSNTRIWFLPALLLTVAGFFVSCASGTGDSGDVPDWLKTYPSDEAYYVGIGGSNTGNLALDRDKAAAAARADLAAQISIQVSSELEVSSSASTEGGLSETVEQRVSQSVEQNLQAVQTVDTWFSRDQGAWVYLRLNKAEWMAIFYRELNEITLRTNTVLEGIAGGSMTETEEMAALGRARKSLLESPWGSQVKDESLETGGFLMEAVDAAISERVAGLAITAAATPDRVRYGEDVTISGQVVSGAGRTLGSYPLRLLLPGGDSQTFSAESSGRFSLVSSSGMLGLETVQMAIIPDLEEWGIPRSGFPHSVAGVSVYVSPVPVNFTVDSEADPILSRLNGTVGDWFSDLRLPVEIAESGAGQLDIQYLWTVSDYPRSTQFENAPYLTEIGAVITISRRGQILAVHEVESYKDGGLNWDQAHERAARGLLNEMAEDPVLVEKLTELLGRN